MNKKCLRWLYGELPELVSRAVISAETAEGIRRHYGEIDSGSGRRVALTVCSVLGALLIGAGIILLLAHNWEDLARPVRTILAVAPLVVSQALGIWILWTGKTSSAWREGVGLAIALAVAAAIALVGQTYHVPGDLGHFLLAWMLLTLPVVYLLGSALPCVLYFAGITGWAGYQLSEHGYPVFYWLLLALAVPYLYLEARKNPYSPRSAGLGWALSLCLCGGIGLSMERCLPGLWTVVYSGLLATLYLVGKYWFGEAPAAGQRPFLTIGALGIPVLALVLTFEDVWHEIGWHYYHYGEDYHSLAAWMDYALAAVLPLTAVGLLVTAFRRGKRDALVFGSFPVVVIAGFVLASGQVGLLAATLLMNAYLLVLGIHTIIVGIRRNRIGIVNGGMLMVTALIIARFFDSDFDFLVRGLAFIGIGAGFLVTNVILVKKMKGGAHAQ